MLLPMTSFRAIRLRRHADYGLVYAASRKHPGASLSFFYRTRTSESALTGARFGITAPRALGPAVLRNRIKRRVRVAARAALVLLPPGVDVVLHPRSMAAEMPFEALQREIASAFATVARRVASGAVNTPLPRTGRPGKGGRR